MTTSPLQILIVDDNTEDRTLYKRLLQQDSQSSYCFLEAELGEEGLELSRTTRPDCILLDYQLPDLDGLEFLAALADEEVSSPVIMLTGFGSETVVSEAMKTGAADYLPKNAVSAGNLKRATATAIEKYQLHAAVEAQRKTLEQTNIELRRKNEEIRNFYHVVSHELKTPLTAIHEFVSIMLDGLAGPLSAEQQEYLGIVKTSCDQITFGLNDLLDATRIETGKLCLTPCRVGIASMVSQAVAIMLSAAQQKEIALQCCVLPDLPDVYIDEKRIMQVLTNLLGNALKFTPAGGEIRVEVRTDPHWPTGVLVSISDTGRGIEPERLAYIFDRLYQVRSDDTQIEGGLGLGLYICRELVRLHGGEIWVESLPGQGSTFFFTVPQYSVSTTTGTTDKKEEVAA